MSRLLSDNGYLAIGVVDPETKVQQAKTVGSVVYEGLKIVVEGLYRCSDMFLPLKTAAGGILTFIEVVEVSGSMYELFIAYSCKSERIGE